MILFLVSMPERGSVLSFFKTHVDRVVEELGIGYDVTIQGRFNKTSIRFETEVLAKGNIP